MAWREVQKIVQAGQVLARLSHLIIKQNKSHSTANMRGPGPRSQPRADPIWSPAVCSPPSWGLLDKVPWPSNSSRETDLGAVQLKNEADHLQPQQSQSPPKLKLTPSISSRRHFRKKRELAPTQSPDVFCDAALIWLLFHPLEHNCHMYCFHVAFSYVPNLAFVFFFPPPLQCSRLLVPLSLPRKQ